MRPDDILLLADYFEGIYCLQLSRTVTDASLAAEDLMLTYSWPGNVSELKRFVFAALASGETGFLNRHLEDAIEAASDTEPERQGQGFDPKGLPYAGKKNKNLSLKDACKTIVEKTEKKIIAQALDTTNWNRRRAAKILDVSYRTLLNKIKAYELK
jgi:two-component system response regulator AtoC